MKRPAVLLLLLLHCSFVTRSQVAEEWVARYNGAGNGSDESHAIAVDGGGNVYVTGSSAGDVTNLDYVTIKYDASGTELWVARYNGPGNGADVASSINLDGQGNVYVTGWSNPLQFGMNYDFATIKYNSLGVQLWVARYNGPDNGEDRAYSLAVDGLGNVYVTGESYSIATTYDYTTIKYDALGVQQWVQTYAGPPGSVSFDQATALAVDGQGNVYVTGRSDSTGPDYATIKYDPSGIQQWVARYNRFEAQINTNDIPSSIALDMQGNVYVTGYSQGVLSDQYCTIKYDPSGFRQWVQLYEGTGPDTIGQHEANAIVVSASGNVSVTGLSRGSGTIDDYGTVTYGSTGVEEWAAGYNGPGNSQDNAHAIAVDPQGNVYVTGESYGNATNIDCATIKYSASGVQQWVARYDGPGNVNDYAYAIAADAQGSVYITGQSNQNQTGSNFDYLTVKYSQPTEVSESPFSLPDRLQLLQNYPNPFNPVTTIRFSIPRSSHVTLVVFDVLGHDVATLVDEKLGAGPHAKECDAARLASGVYFYKLTAGSYVDVKKLIVVR